MQQQIGNSNIVLKNINKMTENNLKATRVG